MVKKAEMFRRPPGPQMGIWSWRYLDAIKTLRLVTGKRIKELYKKFPEILPPGSDFPDVRLETADGRTVSTGDFRGKKHLVLWTGAIT